MTLLKKLERAWRKAKCMELIGDNPENLPQYWDLLRLAYPEKINKYITESVRNIGKGWIPTILFELVDQLPPDMQEPIVESYIESHRPSGPLLEDRTLVLGINDALHSAFSYREKQDVEDYALKLASFCQFSETARKELDKLLSHPEDAFYAIESIAKAHSDGQKIDITIDYLQNQHPEQFDMLLESLVQTEPRYLNQLLMIADGKKNDGAFTDGYMPMDVLRRMHTLSLTQFRRRQKRRLQFVEQHADLEKIWSRTLRSSSRGAGSIGLLYKMIGPKALEGSFDDTFQRIALAACLGYVAEDNPALALDLIRSFETDSLPNSQICSLSAIPALAKHSQAADVLEKKLSHDDAKIRRAAALSLRFLEVGRMIPLLEQALEDDSEDVRTAAAYSLGPLGPDRIAEIGQQLLKDSFPVRIGAAHSISQCLNNESCRSLFVKCLDDPKLTRYLLDTLPKLAKEDVALYKKIVESFVDLNSIPSNISNIFMAAIPEEEAWVESQIRQLVGRSHAGMQIGFAGTEQEGIGRLCNHFAATNPSFFLRYLNPMIRDRRAVLQAWVNNIESKSSKPMDMDRFPIIQAYMASKYAKCKEEDEQAADLALLLGSESIDLEDISSTRLRQTDEERILGFLEREECDSAPDIRECINLEIEGYEIIRRLGEGADGIVYEAKNPLMGSVKIKVFKDPEDKIREAQDKEGVSLEMRIKRRFATYDKIVRDKTHLTQLYELGKCMNPRTGKETYYLVSDYVDAGPVEYIEDGEYVIRKDILANPHAIHSVYGSIVYALNTLHKAGKLLRDIKLRNILCSLDHEQVLVDDLETIAEIESVEAGSRLTEGSDRYAAPEVLEDTRNASQKSDLYSAVVCYLYMLTGKPTLMRGINDAPNEEEYKKRLNDMLNHAGLESRQIKYFQTRLAYNPNDREWPEKYFFPADFQMDREQAMNFFLELPSAEEIRRVSGKGPKYYKDEFQSIE